MSAATTLDAGHGHEAARSGRWAIRLGMAAVLAVALALRLATWGDSRFMEDEALYAYWGLQIATGADPMLDYEPVDKPPLYPYTLALAFSVMGGPAASTPLLADQWLHTIGQMETAARLPSLLASMTGVALVYALGRQLWGDARVGLLTAALVALSPFDILYASTAFTDPLMVALVLAALWAAGANRPGSAGLLAGLAWATKQQALLFLPLVVAVYLLKGRPGQTRPAGETPGPTDRRAGRKLWRTPGLRLVLGLAAVAGAVTWWDALRVQRPGFLAQSLVSYGGLGPARWDALGGRAIEWLRVGGEFWPSLPLNALLVAAVPVALLLAYSRRPRAGASPAKWAEGDPAGPAGKRLALALLAFAVLFLGLHWLLGVQVWDRYLLGLLPVAALLAAWALVVLGRGLPWPGWQTAYGAGLGLALAGLLIGPIGGALAGQLPVGGDHGAYDGIDKVAAYVRAEVPPGAVLYHHWLGYHYRFYLYGAPLRLHWYPDAADLVQDALQYRREPRYIAFPSFRDSTPLRTALDAADIELVPVLETRRRGGTISFRLYRLEGPG